MIEQSFLIVSENGLHARPAAELAREASRWPANIRIRTEKRTVDAKSIMGLLSLAAGRGTRIDLLIEGERADETAQALRELLTRELAEPA